MSAAAPSGPQPYWPYGYGPYAPSPGAPPYPGQPQVPWPGPVPVWGYPPWMAPPRVAPPSFKATLAGVLWVLVLVRDLMLLGLLLILIIESRGRPFGPFIDISPIQEPLTLVVIVCAGAVASIAALACDFTRSRHDIGTVAGLISVGACLTPGVLMGFGVIGTLLAVPALVLHFSARSDFTGPHAGQPLAWPHAPPP